MQKENSPDDKKYRELKRIPSIGELTARALAKEGFESITELKQAELEDIRSIEYVGDDLAKSIINELKDENLEDSAEEKLEVRCPICEKFTWTKGDRCRECEESLKSTSRVVVPDKGLIEKPLKTLASVEEKILYDGEDPESWFIRGSILESMGANRKALESYDRVIELDPLFDHIWNAKANVSLKIGETSEAAKAYKLAFDVHQGPANIMNEIEEKKDVTPKKEKDKKGLDEKDEKLDEKISKARELLGEIEGMEEKLSELTITLDRVIEEKIRGEHDKALDLVETIIERTEALLGIEEQLPELKEEIERIDSGSLKSRAEKDLVKIQELIENNDFKVAKRSLANLSHALEFEKEKLKKKIPSKEELSEMIGRLEEVSSDLTDETDEMLGFSESVSKARESLKENDREISFQHVKKYIGNESELREISEKIEKLETLKMGLDKEFLEDVEERFENAKMKFKKGDYKKAKDRIGDLLDEVEKNIEKSVEDLDEKIETKLEYLEKIIDEGKGKGLDIENIEEKFKDLKEDFESDKDKPKNIIDEIEKTIFEGENTIEFKSNLSEIDEMIEELEGNEQGFIKRKKELFKIFDQGDFEKAVEKSLELRDDIDQKIREERDEKEWKSEAESKLAKARKRLSELRKTDFDLGRMKTLLKKSNKARKKGEFAKCVELSEKFIESADQMLELSEPVEKAKNLIDQLDEKDLIDRDRIEYEIEQYKKLADLEKYDMAEKYLGELIDEMEQALENEKRVPPPGIKIDKSATQIPTQIKEKVRNVKELNNLVEKADIEIEVNREPLKEAIIKIKDIEYEEANDILNEWKEKLIKRLNHKLGDRVDEMSEEIEQMDPPASVKRRGNAIFRDIRTKWERAAFEEALKGLINASEFIEDIEGIDEEQDKEILLMQKILLDLEESGSIDEEIKKQLDRAEENKGNEEEFKTIIENFRGDVREKLKNTFKEEKNRLEDRVHGMNRREVVVAINNMTDLMNDLKKDDLEAASWSVKEFINTVEKS